MNDGLIADRFSVSGCLLGTAVGDAIGLPYENLSRRRAQKLLGPPDRHRFVFRRGMVSDDTEHACVVAQSLIVAGLDAGEFQRQFARRLRRWLCGVPAGVGKATLFAGFRLCLGFSPDRSGVFSAGNGPAMRSPLLGLIARDERHLADLVHASTRITHTDPKAEWAAHAVALAAREAGRSENPDAGRYLHTVRAAIGENGEELLELLHAAVDSASRGQPTPDFAAALGFPQRVTGYALHTVPVAVQAWLLHPRDFSQAVTSVIECGGDADTTAAIVGGIVGAAVGVEGIPKAWIDGLFEHPRSAAWMNRLAEQLARVAESGNPEQPIRLPLLPLLVRNLLFLSIVLTHGFRRLLPPY